MWEVSISVISVLICLTVYGCTERDCSNLITQLQSSLTLPQHSTRVAFVQEWYIEWYCAYIHTYVCTYMLAWDSAGSTSFHGAVTVAVLTVHQ